jgi:RHS repeat-associated protein
MRQGSQVYYLHGDHLGSTSLTTDANGNVVAQVRYLPYGEERWGTGALPTDFGFTGQRQESGFGLYDYNARYYSPYLNRFISPDTVIPDPVNPQNFNRYSYVTNNPLRYVDPSGHDGEPWWQRLATAPVRLAVNLSSGVSNINNPEYAVPADTIGTVLDLTVNAYNPWDSRTTDEVVAARMDAKDLAEAHRGFQNTGLWVGDTAEALGDTEMLLGGVALAAGMRQGLKGLVQELCSFSEETLVATEGGFIPIGKIREGKYVLAYHEVTGELGYYPVEAVWAHTDPVVVYLVIEGERIETTPEHPFYTSEAEWIAAGELRLGDLIRQASGRYGRVQAVEFVSQPQVMYNLTVAEAHTYFVGAGRWLVHNGCPIYTDKSRTHVFQHGHAANSALQPGKSRFFPTEGGAKFTDEVVNHPSVNVISQSNGRIRYDVDDLGRYVGYDKNGNWTRGGTVVVEGPKPHPKSIYNPDEVVTQYPK